MSGDMMSFPDNWYTFVQQYQFVDKEEIYTNGSMLIPSFRVQQMVEHYFGCGECTPHGEWERVSQTQEVRHVFCECGNELGMDERDSFPFQSTKLCAIPNYCEECGRKIRKAVKR